MHSCKICGGHDLQTLYRGLIRVGRFGTLTDKDQTVWRCANCLAGFLPTTLGQSADYYESQKYREEVDESSEVSDYFRLHDGEQAVNIGIIGTAAFRGKVVADVGCGGGSFLDGIRGYCKMAVAIEPSKTFRDSLGKRGYSVFPYSADALREFQGRVDVATSFSVLEHVEDPLAFLKELRELLSSGGKAYISTPNADDLLLDALPQDYPRFFFRKAHLWYFSPESLLKLLVLAGFSRIRLIPHQRFGLSNFLGWMKDRSPQGKNHYAFVTEAMDAAWKAELERTRKCDYLYAEADLGP